MKIKTIIFLVIFLAFGGYILLDTTVKRYIAYHTYKKLDHKVAVHRMETCIRTINREIHHLDQFIHDWSAWDDTYEFVVGKNPRFFDSNLPYIDSNLPIETFLTNEINSLYFYKKNGELFWGKSIDLEREEEIEINLFAADSFPADHPFFNHEVPQSTFSGIVATNKGPLLLASRPIITSESKGPIRGTLIGGKLLDARLVEILRKQTGVDFNFWTVSPDKGHSHTGEFCPDPECLFEISEESMIPDLSILKEINALNYIILREKRNDTLHAYAFIKNLMNNDGVLFRVIVPMDITNVTKKIFNGSLLSNIVGGLLVLAIVLYIINRVIIRPINKLIQHAEQIRSSGASEIKIAPLLEINNEIGVLGTQIDSMMDRLSEAQRQLVDQSYFSGMNEVASGVMHNIRNALNPIIADIDMIKEVFSEIPLHQLKNAREEVNSNTDPERARKLSLFIDKGLQHVDLLISDTTDRLTIMVDRVNTIETILIEQENFARSGINSAKINLRQVINRSLKLLNPDNFSHIKIMIDESVNLIGDVKSDQNALTHILTNFFNNSAEAIARADIKNGKIIIKATPEKNENVLHAHIKVTDNGIGITNESINKIFNRGFSTKSKKTSGVGLHWCANTVAALEGTIYAESDGESGSTMHLIIPKEETSIRKA